jgi:RluA family pseudouridine synthase
MVSGANGTRRACSRESVRGYTDRVTRIGRTVVDETLAGASLVDAVARWLPRVLGRPLSRSAARRLILAGAVRVGGCPLRRPGAPLVAGQTLEARLDVSRLSPLPPAQSTALSEQDILFEDRWLLAVAKPPGLPFHPTADSNRPNFVDAVRRLLAHRAAGTSSPYLGVHQRLDRDTSGCALFVKDAEANAGLAAAFAAHAVTKTYQALTVRPARRVPRSWTIDAPLALLGRGRSAHMGVTPGGDPAQTEVTVVRTLREALLLECRPRTGRKHQIRAHLAQAGLPILGDTRYGGPARLGSLTFPRVLLHALRLELPHPITGATLRIECDEPAAMKAIVADLAEGTSRLGSRRPTSGRRR